ncbi:MAG TPA: ATP synthase F1 subunit gamma [Candidatus Binatia bacterium]|nr:ATP synthase F1 subunit gamma [Candidatus Binatia bacterium]
MPSLKAIRKRIASVRNTQKITKAMKMVSAAKLRRAQEAAVSARPYAQKLSELLQSVAGEVTDEAHPLLRPVESEARVHLVIMTSDRGLCGAYNAALLRQAEAYVRRQAGRDVSLTVVGRKGVEFFRRRSVPIADRHVHIPGPSIGLAREIATKVGTEFADGRTDRVDLLYSAFRSALSQVPTLETLLPIAIEARADDASPAPEHLMEPDRMALLHRLLPQFVGVRIYHALLEAVASEHGARMTAMDSATSNAAKMIFTLTLAMNRARQAAITKELMEIVSGAEALKG